MPQESNLIRPRWGIDSALAHLRRRGFRLTCDFEWDPLGIVPLPLDLEAIDFLFLEWDYGGLVVRTKDGLVSKNKDGAK